MGCRQATLRVALAVAALAASAPAEASPSAKLVYVRGVGAETCPPEAEMRSAVARRLGYDPFFPVATKTVVTQIVHVNGGYRAHVQIVTGEGNLRGERDLATTGDDCAELLAALALAVSIAIDDLDDTPADLPVPAPDARAPEPSRAPDDAPPIPRRDEPPTAAQVRVEPPPLMRLGVALGPMLTVGAAPAPSVGLGLAASARRAAFGARIDVRADLPASAGVTPTGRVSTQSGAASAAACLHAAIPFACLGAGGGVLWSHTDAIAHPASDLGGFVALVAVVGANVALSERFYAEPFIVVDAKLVRPHVDIDGARAFTLPLVAATGGLYVGARFP
jgi:hypothetical protein